MRAPGEREFRSFDSERRRVWRRQSPARKRRAPIAVFRLALVLRRLNRNNLTARQTQKDRLHNLIRPIDEFMIRLIEVRQQTAVAALHASCVGNVTERVRVSRRRRGIDVAEVHHLQRSPRDL
jgi:hypothetical protein